MKSSKQVFNIFILFCYLSQCLGSQLDDNGNESNHIDFEFAFMMPHVRPIRKDQSLCTIIPLKNETLYVSSIETKMSVNVHHLSLSGCYKFPSENVNKTQVWDCTKTPEYFIPEDSCEEYQGIYYLMADKGSGKFKNSPKFDTLVLPKGVSYEIGGESGVKYLYLNVHYADITEFKNNENLTDTSGVIMTARKIKSQNEKFAAEFIMYKKNILIPERKAVNVEFTCQFNTTFYPLKYSVHGHDRNYMISGYRVHKRDDKFEWTFLGKADPRGIEIFRQIENKNESVDFRIEASDWIAVRCKMINRSGKEIHHGFKHEDEMCAYYIIGYAEEGHLIHIPPCKSPNGNEYSWESQFGLVPKWVI